jgi:hypothetical protein
MKPGEYQQKMRFLLLVTGNLKEWGEGEPKRGKYSKLSILNHFKISGDARKSKLSKFSSFKSREKVEYSIGKSPSSNFLRVSIISK